MFSPPHTKDSSTSLGRQAGRVGLLFLCWMTFLCWNCGCVLLHPAFYLHSRNWIWVIRLLWPAPLPPELSPLTFSFFLLLNTDEPSLASGPILLASIPFWAHLYFLAFTEGSFVLSPALVSHSLRSLLHLVAGVAQASTWVQVNLEIVNFKFFPVAFCPLAEPGTSSSELLI